MFRVQRSTPVLTVLLEQDGSSSLPHSFLLPEFVGVDLPKFRQEFFRAKAVAVVRRQSEHKEHDHSFLDQLKQDLFHLDSLQLFQNTASDQIFVWIQSKTEDKIHSIEVDDPLTAHVLYQQGEHSTYCRAPTHVEQYLVSTLIQETGMGGCHDGNNNNNNNNTILLSNDSWARGEVELFQSNIHTTQWHFDFQENFTIQLSGSKKWTLQHSTITHPLRACTPHYALTHSDGPSVCESQLKAARLSNPSFQITDVPSVQHHNALGETDTIVLEPGDTLYFPAGMWHKVETLEAQSVSLNVSLMATNYATVTCQALQHLLLQKDSWRQCLTMQDAPKILQGLLTQLPEIVQTFAQNGGAGAILPPCFVMQSQKSTSDHAEEIDQDDDSTREDGSSSRGEKVLEAPIDYDPLSTLKKKSKFKIVKNPLTILLAEAELTKLTEENAEDHVDDDSCAESGNMSYILHVNYGGNEAQESLIRGKILDETGMILEYSQGIGQNQLLDLLQSDYRNRAIITTLLFYGYYILIDL